MGYFWSGQVGGERWGFFSLHLIQYIMIIQLIVVYATGQWSPKHNTIVEMGPGFQFLLRGGWGGGAIMGVKGMAVCSNTFCGPQHENAILCFMNNLGLFCHIAHRH